MKETEIFIRDFHTLEGTLLKERKRSLYLLLERNKHLSDNQEFLRDLDEKLEPKTYLEETYKLEILLYFRRFQALFDILKKGNDVAASKIIRQSWFIQALFHNLDPKNFVHDVFPELSLIIRSKILKQILKEFKDEQLIDALFDELLQVYGFRPALILLSGCSVSKIKRILHKTTINLSKAQLKLLHDKDPELISFHYEEFYKRGGKMNTLWNFDKYLSRKDPNLYVKLVEKYGTPIHNLGYRCTRKYVAEHKELIIENAKKYEDLGIFKHSALVKEIGKDFPKFFKELFPKQLSDLNFYTVRHMLNYYPKQRRYELYSTIFQEVYKKNLLDNEDFMFNDLLAIIPSHEEREKWVEKFGNEVPYIQFKRSSLSVPELKVYMIKCDDIKYRQQLLQYLVKTCSINEDFDSLLNILKFFYERLRNSDSETILCFLEEIYENIELDQLKEEHWKSIYEILLILDLKDGIRRQSTPLLFEYCKFLYKSSKSFEEVVPLYMKSSNFEVANAEFRNEKFKDENFEKQFLESVLKNYPRLKNAKENCWKSNQIISRIKIWNKRHPNDKIMVSKCEDIINVIVKSMDSSSGFYSSEDLESMKYLVCLENRTDVFADIYFNRSDILKNVTMTKWFLKYQPKILEEKIDKIIGLLDRETPRGLMSYFKKYEHTDLVRLLTKHYRNRLEDQEAENKTRIVKLLASVMPKKDYLNLLDQYAPTVDKMNLLEANEDQKNTFQIQIALARSISNTNYQNDALPIILKYCKGDFLQSALLSLYSCFNRTPEKSLHTIVDVLLTKPVSLRKHSIFLAAMVFPIEMNKNIDRQIIADRNESIQKHLFKSSYKSFLKNPLEDYWNILEKYMENLTSNENESLNILTKIHVVPEQYRIQFARKAWNVFEKLSKKDNKPMQSLFDHFLNSIKDDDIRLLPNEFCLNAIQSKLFIKTHEVNKACINFATKFMMYGAETRTNIQGVLKILQLYKGNYPPLYTRSVIGTFFKTVFEKTMNKRELRIFLNPEFCSVFAQEWKNVFTFTETFEEYVMLDLMVLKYEKTKELTLFASRITECFKNVMDLYGTLIMELFGNILRDSLESLLGAKDYKLKLMKLLSFILREDSSVPFCLLVLQLLPPYQADEEFKDNFDYVLENVRGNGEIMDVFLNTCFKKIRYF